MSHLDHDRDFYAWATGSAARLRAGLWAELDVERIAEELEDMGKQQRQALATDIKTLRLGLDRPQPGNQNPAVLPRRTEAEAPGRVRTDSVVRLVLKRLRSLRSR